MRLRDVLVAAIRSRAPQLLEVVVYSSIGGVIGACVYAHLFRGLFR